MTLSQAKKQLTAAVDFLTGTVAKQPGRNLFMPGDGRYQPAALRPFLGYDQFAGWLIIVEWFWMVTLAHLGEMPRQDAKLLTPQLLNKLLRAITTSALDIKERETKHDILALLALMRPHLPKPLHRWLHFCATSHDIMETAYALQLNHTVARVFHPQAQKVDTIWRARIRSHAATLQAGRTHLQTALPVTVGAWLAVLHNRFVGAAANTRALSHAVVGKFSGAVGTKASQVALLETTRGEVVLMGMLGLPPAKISTQIAPPESKARFYFELVLLSGVLANLGEDVRILQSSQFGELASASSSSSAMPHKTANPIAAEKLAGMHVTVQAEFGKITGTLVSDLQRDLRSSNVLRSFSAILVYTYEQLITAERLLTSLRVNTTRCRQNFDVSAKLVVAEVMHLYLQRAGYADTHHLVHTVIAPQAAQTDGTLTAQMDSYLAGQNNAALKRIWGDTPAPIKKIIEHPDTYLGQAVAMANKETSNKLH